MLQITHRCGDVYREARYYNYRRAHVQDRIIKRLSEIMLRSCKLEHLNHVEIDTGVYVYRMTRVCTWYWSNNVDATSYADGVYVERIPRKWYGTIKDLDPIYWDLAYYNITVYDTVYDKEAE